MEQFTRGNFVKYLNNLCLRSNKNTMVEHVDDFGNTVFEMITFESYRDKVASKISGAVIGSARQVKEELGSRRYQ